MVARSFGRIHNLDLSEAFASTPSAADVKIAVAVANEKCWLLRHLDMKQAFIQPPLDEAVYMRLPADCGDMSGDDVVLLQRAVNEHRLVDKRVCGLVECSCRKLVYIYIYIY